VRQTRTLMLILGLVVTIGLASATTASAFVDEWEWVNGESAPPVFALSRGYTKIVAGHEIICAGDRLVRNEEDKWYWFIDECYDAVSKEPCTSPGAEPAEIASYPLNLELASINGPEKRVGAQVSSALGGESALFAAFTCGAAQYELKGAVIGEITPVDELILPEEGYTAEYATSGGEQDITQFEGGPPVALEAWISEEGAESHIEDVTIESTEQFFAEGPTELVKATK
jgi:hypothetical protein